MRNIFERIGAVVSSWLRHLCDSLSPKARLVVVGILTTIFSVVAIYLFLDSILCNEPTPIEIINIVDYGA